MPVNLWAIHSNKAETERVFRDLSLALEEKDLEKIIKILHDPINGRSFIIRRGLRCQYLQTLKDAFEFVILSETKETDFIRIENSKIIEILHKLEISERILMEILTLAYHLRDCEYFMKILKIILDNQEKISDQEIIVYALHVEAVWTAEVEHDHEKNIELNKLALLKAREQGFPVLEQKITFGLSEHKGIRAEKKLKPRKRLEDFQEFAKNFRQLGVEYDAIRSDIEQAYVYLELAISQNGEIQEQNIKKALTIAKEAHTEARQVGYPTALIQAKEALAQIHSFLGNSEQATNYREEEEKMRQDFAYFRARK